MRILVNTINYSELTGPGKYVTEFCEWLAARGHDVTVVAPPPYYPQWRVREPHRAWRYSVSTEADVRICRTPIWVPLRPAGLARVMYALSFMLSSIPLVLWEALHRPKLVFVTEPSILNLPVAWLAARLGGARAWLHVQDFEIDLAYELGHLRRCRSISDAIEHWLIQRFDVVSSISWRMIERARAKGVSPSKLFSLPNWFDPEIIYPSTEPSSALRSQIGIPNETLVALYAGSLGPGHGVERILEAASVLTNVPICFVICGEGIAESSLREIACTAHNVHFLPLQPAQNLNALLNLADVHLLPQRKGTDGLMFPSKLIGMLASGRPIVAMATRTSEIAECLEGCGICVEHDDDGAFSAAIRQLAVKRDQRLEMGRRARLRALERFRQDVVFRDLEAALDCFVIT